MQPSSERDSPKAQWVVAVLSVGVFALVAALLLPTARTQSMTGPTALAQVNALLNACSALSLGMGFWRVKRGDLQQHKRWMITAFAFSTVFLVTYVLHHLQVGSVKFQGHGWVRALYFSILIPHVVLAAAVVPLALITLYRGWNDMREAHRRIARYTLPIWFYVSASGVAVYFMLYHL